MSLLRFALAGLLLQLGHAAAGSVSSPIPSSQAYKHSATCRTVLGTSSVTSVPTTTLTRRIHDPTPIVVFSTVQDTVTVTPSESTITESHYETTTVTSIETPVTDTFSTTSTEYDTMTATTARESITLTIFSTISITSTATATIATSSGFTPVADTLATPSTYKRSLVLENDCSPYIDDFEYPQEVICEEKVILKTTTTSTVTTAPATTTAVTPSTTVIVTNTITSTSVLVLADISTTLSYSTTSTITVTTLAPVVTDTVTATTVVTAVTTTSQYAACATNNIAGFPLSSDFGSFAGLYIYDINFASISGFTLIVGNSDSAYDCCVSCQEYSNCAMSFYQVVSSTVNYCYLAQSTVCSATSNYATAYLSETANTYEISNGNCGHYNGVQAVEIN
ncbi:hypothetical protein N7466_005843 [Penicillium verhagenii]|uniref:uncharacterized protein n=1 Tax=Penicillium verhagenii TaxID=1562060 RepID=UPI0025452CCC|nr:uncharacterized protein N7466_005843 [Penicillium verhagenii]KAJ5930350.1 hypothetical protein N7466_005843 [Penicillium verhagenii]